MSDLLKINVSEHTEKKNGLTYLSWSWAWTEVLKLDPQATWEAIEFNGLPCVFLPDSTALVKVVVTIKGHSKACWLPVIDHRNKPIPGPNAFQINTAIVRCLTKAISMHGLGLYIYAGEDLPEEDQKPAQKLKIAALDGIGDGLSEDTKQVIHEWAAEATEICRNQSAADCIAFLREKGMEDDERLYMDSKLPSDVRSAMRKVNQPKKEAA